MAIAKKITYVTLNVVNPTVYHTNADFVQGDVNSNVLEITILNYTIPVDLTGYTCQIVFKKSDGSVDTVNAILKTAGAGVIQYTFSVNDLDVPGEVIANVIINGTAGEKLTTSQFTFKIREKLQ